MKFNLLFEKLNDEVILKENIKLCKLEFGRDNEIRTYAKIRSLVNKSYNNLSKEDLNEKEDVLKNKLTKIKITDNDNAAIGGLTTFGVYIAVFSVLVSMKVGINEITTLMVGYYLLLILLSSIILFKSISYQKNIKIIDITFYTLCLEELHRVQKNEPDKNDEDILLEVADDKVFSSEGLTVVKIKEIVTTKYYTKL
ncbi:hypothetical protein [Clostridium sp.]